MNITGKIDEDFFEEYIAPYVGADRGDIILEPHFGADFGVFEIKDVWCAVATDPIFILRDLKVEQAAWYGFHILISDIVMTGQPPSHLSLTFNLPPDITEQTFECIMQVFDAEARSIDSSIITGHTGVYDNCSFPMIGGATVLTYSNNRDCIYPTGATPGDDIVITKGPAIETVGVLAKIFDENIDLATSVVKQAKERFKDISPIRDAITAAEAGTVSAMHDATERGVYNAFFELATASRVKLSINQDAIPISSGVKEICEHFDIDMWTASSEGTVIMTTDPDDTPKILQSLRDAGIPTATIGTVKRGSGVEINGTPLSRPSDDPFWPTYQRLAEKYEITERRSF
ncbi:MAG: AIR synthase family protein [Halobacteriaceae archaeon]